MAGGEQQQQQQRAAKMVAAAAGNGSRFAVTCGLLRQYMKEHAGSNGGGRVLQAVTMSLVPAGSDTVVGAAAAEEEAPEERKTMELFPQQAGTLKDSQERKESEKAPQLTIFYGGRVAVFDDFPARKADELMNLAVSFDAVAVSDVGAAAACHPSLPDMPIARKVSLQRFLEKRKNRLAVAEPSPAAASPPEPEESSKRAKKGVDGASWIGAVNPTLSL